MAFTVYSGIPGRVVSVQVDMEGTFDVVGQGPQNERHVDLKFAQVHVAGSNVDQAQRVVGVEDGTRFAVVLRGRQVVIQPSP